MNNKDKVMSAEISCPETWDASLEEDCRFQSQIHTNEETKDLFNRAAFDGERIIMKSGDASFAIVPIEDVLLLNKQGL